MKRSLIAGGVYFAIVFAAAFALGALRVTYAVPKTGVLWATLLELPFTLAVSWVTCAWVRRRWRISSAGCSIAMGLSAFVLLMAAEFAGSVLIFGRTLSDFIASYATAAGAWGLAGQIAFGLFPVIQCRLARSVRGADDTTG